MVKAIMPESYFRSSPDLSFSDDRWAEIRRHIPESLPVEADARLRTAITECCSWFLAQRARLEEGRATATAMRSPGKRQLALLERVAGGLRTAAEAWKKIEDIHDDRLSDMRRYDDLEVLAQDAERRLKGFRKLGKPVAESDPWPVFVRWVARCLCAAGLKPTTTGRVYGEGNPTWFQEFMAALNDNLLGEKGRGNQLNYSHKAFCADIAKAMRGDRKPGKARK
jgi:hypothetical protein